MQGSCSHWSDTDIFPGILSRMHPNSRHYSTADYSFTCESPSYSTLVIYNWTMTENQHHSLLPSPSVRFGADFLDLYKTIFTLMGNLKSSSLHCWKTSILLDVRVPKAYRAESVYHASRQGRISIKSIQYLVYEKSTYYNDFRFTSYNLVSITISYNKKRFSSSGHFALSPTASLASQEFAIDAPLLRRDRPYITQLLRL